jgi:hypothetical protein
MTETTNAAPKARRGDLVVVHEHRSDFGGYEVYRVGEVAGVRQGRVSRWREARAQAVTEVDKHAETFVTPKAQIDVAAALQTASANPWPHNGMPGCHYRTLDEVKTALRPHLTK